MSFCVVVRSQILVKKFGKSDGNQFNCNFLFLNKQIQKLYKDFSRVLLPSTSQRNRTTNNLYIHLWFIQCVLMNSSDACFDLMNVFDHVTQTMRPCYHYIVYESITLLMLLQYLGTDWTTGNLNFDLPILQVSFLLV